MGPDYSNSHCQLKYSSYVKNTKRYTDVLAPPSFSYYLLRDNCLILNIKEQKYWQLQLPELQTKKKIKEYVTHQEITDVV